MKPEVPYIIYATSYHEQNGEIVTVANFEEGGLVFLKSNAEEYESISASIDELSTDD